MVPIMTPTLLRRADLRNLEASHAQLPLMERAGHAAADVAVQLLGNQQAPTLIFAGPGNNGGDAFVLARVLQEQGRRATVVFRDDAAPLPPDARAAFEKWRSTGADYCREVPDGNYGLVVDGLFGIGLTRLIGGDYAALIERINQFSGPVLALDIASGLDAETGCVHGIAVSATHTASFIAAKPGFYLMDGPEQSGVISIHDLGIDATSCGGRLLDRADFAAQLKPRPRNSHKGTFGSLAVIGGATGMTGAALLSARAGLMLGAGRVFCGLLQPVAVDPTQPELMLRTPEVAVEHASVAVIGPGLGQSDAALALLRRVVSADFSLVLDADALNLIAAHPVLAENVARRSTPPLITPHPTEAARLLQCSTETIQADRIAAALNLAAKFNAHVALKGSGTVVASPKGDWWINTTGNAGLATGGTGDVLSGMLGALLAQAWPPAQALLAAVHLHGAAADLLVSQGFGPIGLTASELIPAARRLLNNWITERNG